MKTLTVPEVCALLKVHQDTLYQLIADGSIPAAKFGRAWVFLEEDVISSVRGEYKICPSTNNPVPIVGMSTLPRQRVMAGELDTLLAPKTKTRRRGHENTDGIA